MKRIPVPNVSYSDVEVTLDGSTYTFTYRFNERSNRWKVDITDVDGEYVVKGLTIVEEFSPTAHLTLGNFAEGLLYVGTPDNTKAPVGFDNFGIDKTYEMIFSTFEEISA